MKLGFISTVSSLTFLLICATLPGWAQQPDNAVKGPGPVPQVAFRANLNTSEKYFYEGSAQMAAGEWAKAESTFRAAIKIQSEDPFPHIGLIFALINQRKFKDAMPEIRTCARLDMVSWMLAIQEGGSPNSFAYVYTKQFGEEAKGILRYIAATKKSNEATQAAAEHIGVALDRFAKENKIGLIYDAGELEKLPRKIVVGQVTDITDEFINYYNKRYPVR